jgi:hypothetical protein
MLRASFLAALLLALVLVGGVGANPIVPPDPKNPLPKTPPPKVGPQVVKVEIEADPRVRMPTLVVPTALVDETPKKGADAGPLKPVLVGVALACAFVTAGFWLLRGGRGARVAAAVTLLVAALLAGAAVQANVAAPPLPIKVELPAGVKFSGEIIIEYSAEAKTVKLRVPPSDLIRMEAPRPPGGPNLPPLPNPPVVPPPEIRRNPNLPG